MTHVSPQIIILLVPVPVASNGWLKGSKPPQYPHKRPAQWPLSQTIPTGETPPIERRASDHRAAARETGADGGEGVAAMNTAAHAPNAVIELRSQTTTRTTALKGRVVALEAKLS